jgi:uncharacterized protein YdaU (DUF1376 family)
MSQAPSMPVFTDALLGDTLHLSAEEFGGYCLLLFATWRNNGRALPDSDTKLARICRVSVRRWVGRLRPVLVEFFDISDGNWRQKRLEKEWQFCAERAAISRKNGSRNGLKYKKPSDPAGMPEETQKGPPHTHTQYRSPKGDSSRASARETRKISPAQAWYEGAYLAAQSYIERHRGDLGDDCPADGALLDGGRVGHGPA